MKMASSWTAFITVIWMSLFHLIYAISSSGIHELFKANISSEIVQIANCPLKCECSGKQNDITIACNLKNLKEFPLFLPYTVKKLDLVGNEIIDMVSNATLKDLQKLNISHNRISSLDEKWISSLKSLQILDLSHNFLFSNNIENKFQNNLLERLNLSNNKLSFLSDIMFFNIKNLVVLNLSFNEIGEIGNNSFQYLFHLSILDLGYNKLKSIEHEWFRNLQNLQLLNLKCNEVSILRNVVFSTLRNLKFLDLSNNHIKSIGLLSFKGLNNLLNLNLSYNDIVTLPNSIFRPLQALEIIDLSSNTFYKIDNIFVHCKNVKYLYLKNLNNFKNVTSFSFSGLRNLEIIDLSYSKVSHIGLKSFYKVKNLRHLYLNNAKLENLGMGVFNSLKNLEVIELSGNPWKCDCHLYWLLMWLGEHTNTHLVSPSNTFCHWPSNLRNYVLLDALDLHMICTNASIYQFTNKTKFKVGLPALLECEVRGTPLPSLTWLTPQNTVFQWGPNMTVKNNFVSGTNSSEMERFYLMPNGNLAIKSVERGDGGFYVCIASNPLSYVSVSIRLTLDYEYFVHIKIISVLVGMATSFGFLLLTLVFILIQMMMKHFGVKCPCHKGSASPRTQQIKKILESMEHYKKQQLDRLRENYNGQVQRIKDNCMQQMERLRESYSSQSERLRDIKEYGTLQIDRIRDNYYSQVQRVRDYSANQIIRLRENYIFQRNRIRKFSAHHLYKLRENYKVQQQHFNKILENLNIESCRNVCQRTESVIFEPEILQNVLVPKISLQTFSKENCDSNDNSSQISAYFTPEEVSSGHESDGQESLNHILNIECPEETVATLNENSKNDIAEDNLCVKFKDDICVTTSSETIV